jgi:glycerol-3-phosphate dehydrogenase
LPTSREQREHGLALLESERFDLVVIGAGIVGSRIAYEAASGGLRVALVDAGDFGGATSSASSKLLHGGLRYLATGDVRLVRRLQRERQLIATRIAPGITEPLPLLLVCRRTGARRRAKLTAALGAYAALSGLGPPWPRLVARSRAAAMAPVQAAAIASCGVVHETWTHDARLTLATVRRAVSAGAVALNYVRVVGFEHVRGSMAGVALEDARTGAELTVRCAAVVNATGPWVDTLRRLADPRARPIARLSKGVHVFLPLRGTWKAGVALFDDSRSVFAVPWHGMLMLGVTDTPFDGDPADARPERDDVETLLSSLEGVLAEGLLDPDAITHTVAGLRVLPLGPGETSLASRRHLIHEDPSGLVSVAGGKLTAHRLIAMDALSHLRASVRPRRLTPSGATVVARHTLAAAAALGSRTDPETARHLLRLYGAEAARLLAYPEGFERIHPGGPDVWAQALMAVDKEWALTAGDIAARRTTLAVRGLAEDVSGSLAAVLSDDYVPAAAGPSASRSTTTWVIGQL